MTTFGGGVQSPSTGASPSAPSWLQSLLAGQNPLNPPSPQAQGMGMGFEQQLMQHGGYNTPPAQNQNPWLQGQPGINPQLQGMLSNLPPRPTGLPPGMMSTPPPTQPGAGPGAPGQPPGPLTMPPAVHDTMGHGVNDDHTGHAMGGPAGSGAGFGKNYMDLGRVGSLATRAMGLAGPAFGLAGAGVRGFANANNFAAVNAARVAQGLSPYSGWAGIGATLGLNGIGSRTGGLANRGAPTSSGMDAAAGSAASRAYSDRMSDRTGGSRSGADHPGGGHTNGQDRAAAGRDAARN